MHDHEGSVCLSSLVIGALAGAGLALLVAPRRGSETRSIVSGRVHEGADYARDLASRAKEKGRQLAEAAAAEGREAAKGAAGEGSESALPARLRVGGGPSRIVSEGEEETWTSSSR